MPGTLEFTLDTSEVAEFLETRGDLIVANLRSELQAQTLNLLSYIKDDKLSGQILSQRSGNLKNSGFAQVEDSGNEMTGTVSFGMTVPYAAIHEFGGAINVPEVSGKLMVFERAGGTVFTRRHQAFTVHMPARPYANPSLDEKSSEIVAGLQGAVDEAVK